MRTQFKRFRQWWLSLVSGAIFLILGLLIFFLQVAHYTDFSIILSLGFLLIGGMRLFFVFYNYKYVKDKDWFLVNGFIEVFVILIPLLFNSPEELFQIYIGFILLFRCIIGIGVAVNFYQSKLNGWFPILSLGVLGFLSSFCMIWIPFTINVDYLFFAGLSFILVGGMQFGFAFVLRQLSLKYSH